MKGAKLIQITKNNKNLWYNKGFVGRKYWVREYGNNQFAIINPDGRRATFLINKADCQVIGEAKEA